MNSGYSEIEDRITISDDAAYLDYNSCRIIKQAYPDDDFNIKYRNSQNSNATEIYNEKDMNLHSLLFGDDSTLSSISDSIKEHEESAKKMLDGDSEIDHEDTSLIEARSGDALNADIERPLSTSSVSSHEDIIIPFARKKQRDRSNSGNRKSENDIEMAADSSKKENQSIASIKRPYSTFKKQSLKRTLLTEPKQLTNFPKRIRKQKECKKDSEQIKKKILEKSKNEIVLSGQKAFVNQKNSSVFSTQKAVASSEGKCALPKNHMIISNKKLQPAKRNIGKNIQKSSKITTGVVLTKKLEFKIPKINKESSSDVKSNIETTAHQTEGSTLDKKTPSIARKPNKWASRSKFLITDFTTEKQKPPKTISAVLKPHVKSKKVAFSTNLSSSIDREINEIGRETTSEMSISNVTTDIQNFPIPVINTPRIANSNRRTDRKSLNDDSNLLKIPADVSRSVSHNQVLPELMKEQVSGNQEFNFKSHAVHSFDKNKTPIISGDNLQQSKEQNVVLKQQFPSSIAETSTINTKSTEWQLFFKDIGLNYKSDSIHTVDKGKTPVISENYFQPSTDQTIVSKLPLNVTTASYSETTDLLNNAQMFPTNHHNKTVIIHKKDSDRKNFMIKTIVEWKEIWFKEYEMMNTPHESLTNGVLHIPLYFSSLNHYISSFISMLLLEIWDRLYIAYKPIQEDERKVTNKFYFIVTDVEMKWDVAEYQCEALINHLSFEPKDGNLVVMFIKDKSTESINPIFGYINSYEIQSNNNINPELLNIDESWAKEARLYRFSVLVKIRPQLSPVLNNIMKGNGLCCILNYLKLVEAAQNLEYSPLCQSILIPDSDIFFSNYPDVPSTSTFNKTQMSIIQGISSEIGKHTSDPKLFLIQGAPGTGKTHIILGLLENLISSCLSKQKILIAAPTSQAIDEIGSRLIEMNKRLRSWHPHGGIRFIRVNLQEKTSEKMKPFSLDEIYAEYKIRSKMEKLKNINMQIQVLLKSNDPLDQADLKSLIEQEKDLRSQIEFMQSDKKTRLDYYHYLLQESQIILTTVSCCSSELLQDFCKQNWNLNFSCCVIDEVTQCTELELLQVISLGINKLILVGNQYGLPPVVLSKKAKNLGYERSTFERFLQYFSHTKQDNPAIELLLQYRMHSEICYFPSYYFYGNQLTAADGIDSRYEHFLEVHADKKLAPYTVFHMLGDRNLKLCTDSIIKLCIQSVTIKPNLSIGIIVPSKELLDVFKNWIRVLRSNNSNYEVIEVGTVEDFQGQEKDIVFLCCYKVSDQNSFLSNSRKLNVALTRARQCLILCLFLSKQNMEQDWVNLSRDAQYRRCFYFIKTIKAMSLILK
ncbi:putative helicase senataxin like protein [Argiope bruennichi]|uniref:Putative helicase senataxin like protein n=1 Tax=Argiope bruennichi TaxID=94029 RepID=A0A8T0FA57_ARGBR|nr:putative helicase senataxin like protein [Argiope bruennichi]